MELETVIKKNQESQERKLENEGKKIVKIDKATLEI